MNGHIVIGANFGDEAKAKFVNHLAEILKNPIVVRSNGGGQVSHTVETENARHVFNHIGAGHFQGVPTYFSKHFITNPIVYIREYQQLGGHNSFFNPESLMTTPYDMMLNQVKERSRDNRHGSCGLGINETIVRSKLFPTPLKDFIGLSLDKVEDKITEIFYEYFIPTFAELNLRMLGIPHEIVIENFANDVVNFLSIVKFTDDSVLKNYDNVIFEMGQGLLLDQDHKFFPHVTHSKTGVHNPAEILKGLGVDHSDVYYITRPYLTRHGAGPLPFEVEKIYNGEDKTNTPNEYQGTIRYAPLNIDLAKEEIQKQSEISSTEHLVINCMDHLKGFEEDCQYVLNDTLHTSTFRDMLKELLKITNFDKLYISDTPKSIFTRLF